jgi:NAD(P)-dependent dehydrogenase (short-subunit alcohol dehydrogenase family)
LDVTSPQEQLDEIAKTAWGVYGHIDVLVNNAGYIENGILEEMRSVPNGQTGLEVLR